MVCSILTATLMTASTKANSVPLFLRWFRQAELWLKRKLSYFCMASSGSGLSVLCCRQQRGSPVFGDRHDCIAQRRQLSKPREKLTLPNSNVMMVVTQWLGPSQLANPATTTQQRSNLEIFNKGRNSAMQSFCLLSLLVKLGAIHLSLFNLIL